jgi:hypothetical protein
MSEDVNTPVGERDKKRRVTIRRARETITTYEVNATDDDELLARIAKEGTSMNKIRLALGLSIAANLVLSVEMMKTRYQLPYSDAIQVVEASVGLGVFLFGLIWSRQGDKARVNQTSANCYH